MSRFPITSMVWTFISSASAIGFDVVVAGVELGADALRAEFLLDGARAIDKREFVTDRQDADLLWT